MTEHPPTPATIATVDQELPLERWKSELAAAVQAPAADRHTHFSSLLDDLDDQVSGL